MDALYDAHELIARSGGGTVDPNRPPVYKVVGLCLAIASGLLIGASFVLKKVGLLKANEKYNEVAGEGYGYLKNYYWWGGMTLMIVGEICNFVAYAFVDAILVTPLGALSVVVTTILSAIFLKERLSFVGKVGCFNCIIGSVVIVLNAPSQSAVADIQQMQHFVISPGFLSYAGVIIVACTGIAWWAGPRYGKKSMLVYLTICSLIGGLSVVATQGLGSAIVAQAGGKPQFNQWFLYVLLVFVIATLLTEIIYLNKALNLFNAALVTPTYYVIFTSATIVTSAILFRGFKGTPISITTVIMGFLQICSGVVLLQLSKSSKDIPDAAVFSGDLDQIRHVAEQEQPESEPKADAIRGTAALVRRFSSARQKMEEREFERLRQEKLQDQLEPLRENEIVEWDGLRRRKTVIGDGSPGSIVRRRTIHPPLGMSTHPDPDQQDEENLNSANNGGVFGDLRRRASTLFSFQHQTPRPESTIRAVPLNEIVVDSPKGETSETTAEIRGETAPHTFGLPAALRRKSGSRALWSPRSKPLPPDPTGTPQTGVLSPPNSARRQWSFTSIMGRHRSPSNLDGGEDSARPPTRTGLTSKGSSYGREKAVMMPATEEERLGLVKGDSTPAFPKVSLEHLPTYPPPTLTKPKPSSQIPPSPQHTSVTPSLHKEHYILPSLVIQRNQEDSVASASSDSSDDFQTISRPDSDILSPRTMTAIAKAAEKASSTTTNSRNSGRSAPTSFPYAKPGTRQRLEPSPPPSYQQAQAQAVMPRMQRRPSTPMEDWPLPRATTMQHEIPSPDPDPPQVREATSQDQRGRVLARGSAQIVQVSDRSRSSSKNRNPTTTHGRSTSRAAVDLTNKDSEPTASKSAISQDDADTAQSRFVSQRPITLYEGDGYGSPMSETSVSFMSQPIVLPEPPATPFEDTRGRFEARSRRERAKRRTRMSMGPNTSGDRAQ